MEWRSWGTYVSVADRQRQAKAEVAALRKQGVQVEPVVIEGRSIARTFWGKAWCDHLEGYSDFATRLPRGRSYVRNGAVVDLQLGAGTVAARVRGSDLYTVTIEVAPVAAPRWRALCRDCAGGIASVIELLQGKLAQAVMARLCTRDTGLFPGPREITMSCSCPDHATMCKHVAAVLYGVGARLDHAPELLFTLRQVQKEDLIAAASRGLPTGGGRSRRILDGEDLGALFGLELVDAPAARAPRRKRRQSM